MNAQRGSVLATVIGMAAILSISAAGFLFLAANSRSEEDIAFQRARCEYDAESGLRLGAGCLRKHDSIYIADNQGWMDTSMAPIRLDNGCTVNISIHDNSATVKTKTIISRAAGGSQGVRLAWENPAVNKDPDPPLVMTGWKTLSP